MTRIDNGLVECPVCAVITAEPRCPRCDWSLRDEIVLDPFGPGPSIDEARKHWNLQAALRAAGPAYPPGPEIERFCVLAGLPGLTQEVWSSVVQPMYERIYPQVARGTGGAIFEAWLTASMRTLDATSGARLGIVELSLEGIAQCTVSRSTWGSVQRSEPVMTAWSEVIPRFPDAGDRRRFFLAGGRLSGFPSGKVIAANIDDWVSRAAPAFEACAPRAAWNRLPGWIVPGLVLERLGGTA